MKKHLGWALALLVYAQNYNHPTTGQQNTYSGGCQVHTCTGNYYDNGGPTGNYANDVDLIYWTFCPNADNLCLRAQFTSFDVESGGPGLFGCGNIFTPPLGCYDLLLVLNGPAQNSPLIWGGCGTTGPGTVTSSNASGCLTFRFCSDGSVRRPGWAATLSCVPCSRPAAGNSDCSGAVCIATNISDISNGPGNSSQCGGCITNENYTNFYIFQPSASGTLTLSVCPTNGTDDYDIAIWGPFTNNSAMLSACNSGSLGTPVRCSYAMYPQSGGCGATNPCTRLATGGGCSDVSEDVCGNGCLAPLSVTAGSTYLLMINGWTAGAQGYNLSWGGVPLTCTPLSQPVVAFRAEARPAEGVFLRWNYDPNRLGPDERLSGWAIDRSGDGGQTWQTLAQLPLEITTYLDRQPFVGENLYRLRFGYEDGRTSTYLTTQRVEWAPAEGRAFSAWYDPAQESIHIQLFDQGVGGEVRLYTIDGRLLHVLPLEPSPFLSAVGFPIPQPGTYIVTYGGHSITVPVVR